MASSSSSPPSPPLLTQVALAGSSNALAAMATNPIDVVKIRLQMHGENTSSLHQQQHNFAKSPTVNVGSTKDASHFRNASTATNAATTKGPPNASHQLHHHQLSVRQGFVQVYSNDGIRGFYRGLTASICREMSYSGIRMGLYEPTKIYVSKVVATNSTSYNESTPKMSSSLTIKVVSGAITGCVGSALANPFDLVKVRMQSATGGGGRNVQYTSIWDAFQQIIQNNEGGGSRGGGSSIRSITGLWRGSTATIQRATLLTASQVPSYDHFKHYMINHGYLQEGIFCHFISSMVAGIVAAAVTSPVDLVKSRVMIQPIDPATGNGMIYSNSMSTIQCMAKIMKTEHGGIFALYKGFHAQWLRIGPHTTISLMVFEQLRHLFGMAYL